MTQIIEGDPSTAKYIEPEYKTCWIMAMAWLKAKDPKFHAELLECYKSNGVGYEGMWFLQRSTMDTKDIKREFK